MFLYRIIDQCLNVFVILVIIRAIMSWFSPSYSNALYRIVCMITEPILAPIQRKMPYLGGIDISPIVVILLVQLVRSLLFRLLVSTPIIL